MSKSVALAADHGGYELKEHIRSFLEKNGIEVIDFGTNAPESCDYPDYAEKACAAVISGNCRCALLFCGTGVGISMAANKINGIRACCCSDTFSAQMSRRHNDSNVLCVGGRVIDFGLAETLVELFLDTEFEGGRHQRRVDKIRSLEGK